MTDKHIVNLRASSPVTPLAGTTVFFVSSPGRGNSGGWYICTFCYGCSVVVLQNGEDSAGAYTVSTPSSALSYLGGVLNASSKSKGSRIFGVKVTASAASSGTTLEQLWDWSQSQGSCEVQPNDLQDALKNAGLIGGLDKAPSTDLPFWNKSAVGDLTEALAQDNRGVRGEPRSGSMSTGGMGIDYANLSESEKTAPHMAPAIRGVRSPAEYISVIRKAYLGTK